MADYQAIYNLIDEKVAEAYERGYNDGLNRRKDLEEIKVGDEVYHTDYELYFVVTRIKSDGCCEGICEDGACYNGLDKNNLRKTGACFRTEISNLLSMIGGDKENGKG